jgi:CPA1 family monovalent cation:H+ antiporter
LKVEEADSDFRNEGQARLTLLEGLVVEIDSLIKEEESAEYRESLERWRVHYQDRLRVLKQRLALWREVKRYAAHKDRDLLPKLMNQTRRRLAKMRRQGIISEEVRRRIERDFDMDEQRIQRFLARLGRD